MGAERSEAPASYIKNHFLCNTQSWKLFPRNLREDFFLKIGILSPKVYTKKVPNIEECNFIPALLRSLATKQVIVNKPLFTKACTHVDHKLSVIFGRFFDTIASGSGIYTILSYSNGNLVMHFHKIAYIP